MDNSLKNELEKAQSEIALLKKEITRLSEYCSKSVSRAWIWLSVFFFFVALLMGSIALDYKEKASIVVEDEASVPNNISTTVCLN